MVPSKALCFINGEFVPSHDGRFFEHIDPSTGQLACEVANGGLLDVVRAIQSANKALPNWLRVEAEARALILEKAAELFSDRSDALARLQASDTGTPISLAKRLSIPAASERFKENARALRVQASGGASPVSFHPVGIAACVTTWSDPFDAMAIRVAAALASGNVVIAKPSEYAPSCGHAFAELLRDAGLPAGVFNLVQGRGAEAGHAIAQHPGLHHVAFCGSTEVGKLFQTEGAETLKKIHLSLGAKNPILVFPGDDLEQTAKAVVLHTMISHPSQCLRGSRVFIQESIFKDFLNLLAGEIRALKIGNACDPATQVGPLIDAQHVNRFRAAVHQALGERGKPAEAEKVLGPGGFFVEPTLISDLTYCSTLQQTEVLGPLITATSFKYQHDAIKHANTGPYGHTGYVFERDVEKARRVSQKLETGVTYINTMSLPFLPQIKGLKHSGLGHSISHLREFFSYENSIVETSAR
jgi:acyl-CoA reductase-like NAD-dependent aldehyde dehydrogenase